MRTTAFPIQFFVVLYYLPNLVFFIKLWCINNLKKSSKFASDKTKFCGWLDKF